MYKKEMEAMNRAGGRVLGWGIRAGDLMQEMTMLLVAFEHGILQLYYRGLYLISQLKRDK